MLSLVAERSSFHLIGGLQLSRTYEEMYGVEKAAAIKAKQRGKRKSINVGKTPWNKNLTKETDSRVAKYAKKCQDTLVRLYTDSGFRSMHLATHWSKSLETREMVSKKAKEAISLRGGNQKECNPNWLGGPTDYPREFNAKLKSR